MSAEVLNNPQHEKFAQLVASGMDETDAYRRVWTKSSPEAARSSAARLLANAIVRSRVKWIQLQSATATTLDMRERREILARIARLNLCFFSAKEHGDLLSSIERLEGSEGEPGILKMKIDGKRACIMADAELAGELVTRAEVKHQHSGAVALTLEEFDRRLALMPSRS